MTKIFNVKNAECKRDKYDKLFRCEFKSEKGRTTNTAKEIQSAFLIKKPSKDGSNLIASGYTGEHSHSVTFFNKKCAIVKVKPIMNVEGTKELIPSREEMVCADSKAVLNKFIKEQEI